MIEQKGKEGEMAFQKWLNENSIGFLHIGQSKTSFPSLFRDIIKRPDFFVLFDGIGVIAIDVKNKELSGGVFTLDSMAEVNKILGFQKNFLIPVWYVYYREYDQTWYWIKASRAQEVGKLRTNVASQDEFFAINISEFVHVKTYEDLGKLLTQRNG